MMKLTESVLKGMIRKVIQKKLSEQNQNLQEQLEYSDIVPGGDGDMADYAKRVDQFLEETVEKAQELHDEAEEIMQANILGPDAHEVQNRNEFLKYRAGYLSSLISNLLHQLETQKRYGYGKGY